MYIKLSKHDFESSKQACKRLEISSQTLYAYVSRGLLRCKRHPNDSRKRLYASVDIDQLIIRQSRGRSRQAVARSTIDFGEPILRSKISRIEDGQFYYRSRNAVELSRWASLEDVFELLCKCKIKYANHSDFVSTQTQPFNRFVDALANEVNTNTQHGNTPYAFTLLRLMAQNAAACEFNSPKQSIHQLLANAWSDDKRAPDLIRRALVLSADHELNASSYATRVTASAGASLSACLLTGISTLSGARHGGLTELCLSWMRKNTHPSAANHQLLNYTEDAPPPGFGHRLYPNGDPRATEMLASCALPKPWQRLTSKVIKQVGVHPTLDLGLANLEHQLQLPKGSGFSIFAVGRTVGWLAHCFEQRKDGGLISPRAS